MTKCDKILIAFSLNLVANTIIVFGDNFGAPLRYPFKQNKNMLKNESAVRYTFL